MHSFLLSALLCLSPPATPPAAPQPRELMVLVLFDATRADHLGCYGYKRPTTPNVDKLAAKGTRFTQAFSNAPWTRPSTTSFLTGLNTSRHRTETETSKIPGDITTLAERLDAAGWHTAGFVANGHAGSMANQNKGFKLFEDPTKTYVRGQRGKPYMNGLPTGPFIAEHALNYLRDASPTKQFVFLFFIDAHDPYEAPPELEKLFLGDFHGSIRRRASWEYNNDYPADERFSMMAVYDAGLRAADDALGHLAQGVEAMKRYDKVTWVLSADHGEAFGEHHFYLHAHHFWDEVIHIPLVVSGDAWPRDAPRVDDRLTQSLDVTRTVAELSGAKTQGLVGHSLTAAPAHTPVISEYNEYGIHRSAIFDEAFKVVWQRPADEAWYMRTAKDKKYFPSVAFDHEVVTVFDRKNDPGEQHDLAANMPPQAADLLRQLRDYAAAAPR